MGYWKWLFKVISGIKREQLGEIWWFVKSIGGLLLIIMGFMFIFFNLVDNELVAFFSMLICSMFFGITWVIYNIEK